MCAHVCIFNRVSTGILVLITSNVIIFVVILILVLALVVFVSREEVCTKGEYFAHVSSMTIFLYYIILGHSE
jgi:hypothetical protein